MAKSILGFVASSANASCAVDIRKHMPAWQNIRNTSPAAFLSGRECWPETHPTKSILQSRAQLQRIVGTYTHSRGSIASSQVSVLQPISSAYSNLPLPEKAARLTSRESCTRFEK